MKNYYEILNVEENSSQEQIKTSYRNLCKKYHPDVNKEENSEEKFKSISEAYNVLSDEFKKNEYDRKRKFNNGGFERFSNNFRHSNFDNFFRQRQQNARGRDININITLNIFDFYNGVKKRIEFRRKVKCNCESNIVKCETCNGSGWRNIGNFYNNTVVSCDSCNGGGSVKYNNCNFCGGSDFRDKKEVIEINFEKYFQLNKKKKINGYGDESPSGINGDFYINVVDISPYEKFMTYNGKVSTIIDVDIIDCILGKTEHILLPDGNNVEYKIEPMVSNNDIVELKGHGYNIGERDSIYLIVKQIFPIDLTEKQKKLLRQFKKIESEK